MVASTKRLVLIVASLFAFSPAMALADSNTTLVNCARGDAIQAALGKKNPHQPLTVMIRGVCAEHVTIQEDDVTLQGEVVENDGISGSVTIDGARRVVVAGLTIGNPTGNGVTITNGGSATIRGNHINDSSGYGLFLRHGSFALVNDNTMLRNGIVNQSDVDASGIAVSMGSTVRAARNLIAENANTGIEVFDNSTYRSEHDSIAMRVGIGRSAVDTFRAGHVDLRGVTVNGPVLVNQQSQLQARNLPDATSVITGNLSVSQLSFLRLRAGVVRAASTLSCGISTFAVCQCDTTPASPCPTFVP